ncbi:Mov34/MPN/PAD-1 family protein [Asticcacaulis sp.]|uniref:Mov34/MPN/PAD-1 family protein n=1 Tax=Asticcacaulis sp. TaxID=1872648 RepID=UPI00391A62F8
MEPILLEMVRREIAALSYLSNLTVTDVGNTTQFEFDIDLAFGDRWLSEGSPGGVLTVERVRLDFFANYPIDPPLPSVRADFNRTLAHVMPSLTADGRTIPCLVDGSLAEFALARGLTAVLDQFRSWLLKAAADSLIDPRQGWEPMRRDNLKVSTILDTSFVRALSDGDRRRNALLPMSFAVQYDDEQLAHGFIQIGSRDLTDTDFRATPVQGGVRYGQSAAIVVWASPTDAELVEKLRYAPDTVETCADLLKQATDYRVGARLSGALNRVNLLWGRRLSAVIPIAVVFLVKRPFALIHQSSDIEIIPYMTQLRVGQTTGLVPSDRVLPASSINQLNKALLRQASGTADAVSHRWIAIGAGSLGGKIAMHLGRSGTPPVAVIDNSWLKPHNVARHALYPTPDDMGYALGGYKANDLSAALAAMNDEPVRPFCANVCDSGTDLSDLTEGEGGAAFLLNTTASLGVREFLAKKYTGAARVMDGELYSEGRLAVLRTEGVDRNPNVGELVSQFYSSALATPEINAHLSRSSLDRLEIGEGCGSVTMICPDTAISIPAGFMAERVQRNLQTPDAAGEIVTWLRSETGIQSFVEQVEPWIRLDTGNGWSVSVSPSVDRLVREDRLRHLPRETGGILIGRVSRASRTLYLTDLLPAPVDSQRRVNLFTLGTEGITAAISDVISRSQGRLCCLGTWHSHAGAADESNLDRRTARALGLAAEIPQILLILGANGYNCFFDMGDRADG